MDLLHIAEAYISYLGSLKGGVFTTQRVEYWKKVREEELIKLFKGLKNKKKPNIKGREHWMKMVSEFPWQ